MYIFWENISKFPRFFISVLVGFLLTIFKPIFESFKKTKTQLVFGITISVMTTLLLCILREMLGLN